MNSSKEKGQTALAEREDGETAAGAGKKGGSGKAEKPSKGGSHLKRRSPLRTIGKYVLYGLAFIFTAVATLVVILAVSLNMMCSDSFPDLQSRLVTTFLETGQLKFIPSLFLSDEKIQAIVNENSMADFNEEVDSGLIDVGGTGSIDLSEEEQEWGDIEIFEVKGSTFYATMLYLKDPSRLSVATVYPWTNQGVSLDKLVESAGAIGGINGGLYNSTNNGGGAPFGVVVSNGEIQKNEPQSWPGLVLIGLTNDHILQIIPLSSMTPRDVEEMVKEKGIRDAVTFQEESSDASNHFVQLIINGEPREMSGTGSGLNPRTAIGQRADGSLLLLVTDGRGKNGHTGASAFDLINVMMSYGAVNAANLDGGSSSCMYYEGEFLMDSVTFYYSNSSWKLPAGFVIK
ncbi:MAG: phosphodiester glycosidase family protein [Oscillospiraceae bacterium]|nr:phosphodiester glycosidase family protein [Oscillospiraceae bacterium]